jgi:hypothetical protein
MKSDMNKIGELAVKIYNFDHTYVFSDDFRVWKDGEEERNKLVDATKTMNLSVGDKLFMIEIFENLWNDSAFSAHYDEFSKIDKDHILWPYKSGMYSIAGITKQDLLFSPIQ